MSRIDLTGEQKKLIHRYLGVFEKFTKTSEFREHFEERKERRRFFQEELPLKIDSFTESDCFYLISNLWASMFWTNKDYHVSKIIEDNGIDKIKEGLRLLMDVARPVSYRYEHFLKKVKGLGPSSVTEIMSYIQPDKCGIWNLKARQALELLKLSDFINTKKYYIKGTEYERFNELLREIAKEITPKLKGRFDVDLLFVDFFLYAITTFPSDEEDDEGDFDHDEIKHLIYDIGLMLGFEANEEVPIGHGARVDVVWKARIGNLGMISYVFEVHRSGSIDSLLLNLQKARRNPTVQKVIAVSSRKLLEKIQLEAEGLPEEFRRTLGFWRVKEVVQVKQNLEAANEIIKKLGLTAG